MEIQRRFARSAAALLAVLALQACGGEGPTPPPPPTTPTPPPPPVTTIVAEGAFSDLEPFHLAEIPFTTAQTGTVDVTVDWTFAVDDVDIWVVKGTCTIDEFNGGTCPFERFSMSRTNKPERISLAAAEPADYSLYIGNRGPEVESVSYVVALTYVPGATSSSRSAPDGAWSTDAVWRSIRN